MSFDQQIIATLIGTFAGFLGSLILFWIKISWDAHRQKLALLKNLEYEIDYNINFLNQAEKQLTDAIEKISADSRNVYLNLRYSLIARFFAIQFYQAGLIKEYLNAEDMKRWNDFMVNLDPGADGYVQQIAGKWRAEEISKQEIYDALEFERKHITAGKEFSEYLKGRIKA